MSAKWEFSSASERQRSQVRKALERLVIRIEQELSTYEDIAKQRNDHGRLRYVEWTRELLSTDGAKILTRLRSTIERLDALRLDDLHRSIQASIRLADLAKKRDLTDLSNWDLVWEWALDILPSLERACERFDRGNEPGVLPITVSKPEPIKARSDTGPYWSGKLAELTAVSEIDDAVA